MDWINIEDQTPEDGQDVFYFFDILGVYKGKYKRVNYYDGYPEMSPVYDDCFYGSKGFLTGDVTHWMPAPSDEAWDNKYPDIPTGYVKVSGTHFNGYTHIDNAITVRKDEFEGMKKLADYCREGHLLGLICPDCIKYHIYWEEEANGYKCSECLKVYDTEEVENNPKRFK